ncbi:MAG TPA: hypothetical protein VHO06_17015 [Polyangia bacterium]|nr:hypothetical protein [Polyangia bacterium]
MNRHPSRARTAWYLAILAVLACSGQAATHDGGGTGGAGAGGVGGARDGGHLNDAGHDTSSGACWTASDCHGGSFCTLPGQSACGGACPTVTHPCSVDSDCAGDAAAPQICVVEPCVCGPTNMGCLAGCLHDADCAQGESCGADHHCAPTACGGGAPSCPTDFACGAGGTCARKRCTSDGECSSACVEGQCYDRPGSCQLAVP